VAAEGEGAGSDEAGGIGALPEVSPWVRPLADARGSVGHAGLTERRALAFLAEEAFEELDALGGADSFDDFEAVVEDFGIREAKFASHASETKIAGAEDQASDAGVNQGAGAHHARFQGDVEATVFKAVIFQALCRLANGDDFGVGGGVGAGNGMVVTFSDYLAAENKYCADGDFARRFGLARKRYSTLHPPLVSDFRRFIVYEHSQMKLRLQ